MNWSLVRYLRFAVCVVVLQPLLQNCSSLRVRHLAQAFASARDRLRVVRDRLSHKGCSSAVTVLSPSPAAVPSSPPLLSAAVPPVLSLAPSFLPSSAPPAPSVPLAGAPSPLPLAPASEDPLEPHCTPSRQKPRRERWRRGWLTLFSCFSLLE